MSRVADPLADIPLDWSLKGLPDAWIGKTPAEATTHAPDLFGAGVLPPVAVLKQSALRHNSEWMRRLVARTGVALAPHGKTTMAPALLRRQLDDGAWGLTAATASHVRVYRAAGARRVLLANQLYDDASVSYVVGELTRDPGFEFSCQVDSVQGVRQLDAAVARCSPDRPLDVLLEVGLRGGRTGVTETGAAIEVARAVQQSARLTLCGVAAYEGVFGLAADPRAEVRALLSSLMETLDHCRQLGLLAGRAPAILSVGGSGHLDIVADALHEHDLGGVLPVLRSGCYLTHDDGLYERLLMEATAHEDALGDLGGLRPALQVWSIVQSIPEPGRAVCALGKRDVGTDAGAPRAVEWRPRCSDRAPQPLPEGHRVSNVFDQHLVLDIPRTSLLQVGDWIGVGVSHPCTTFDRWRWLAVVDDAWHVREIVRTYF